MIDATRSSVVVGLLSLVLLTPAIAGEKRDWRRASEAGTSDALLEFLKRYPDGRYEDEALKALRAELWRVAKANDTVEAWEAFLEWSDNPVSTRRAHLRLETLLYDAAVKTGRLEDLEAHVARFPDGRHREELVARIDRMTWDAVKSANDREACVRFRADYPQSRYLSLAAECVAWFDASDQATWISHKRFLEKYPDSEWGGEAVLGLRALLDKKRIDDARSFLERRRSLAPDQLHLGFLDVWTTTGPSYIVFRDSEGVYHRAVQRGTGYVNEQSSDRRAEVLLAPMEPEHWFVLFMSPATMLDERCTGVIDGLINQAMFQLDFHRRRGNGVQVSWVGDPSIPREGRIEGWLLSHTGDTSVLIAGLRADLDSDDDEKRGAAIRGLGMIGGDEAEEILIRGLTDASWHVRKGAAQVLGIRGTPSAIAALVEALESPYKHDIWEQGREVLLSSPDAVRQLHVVGRDAISSLFDLVEDGDAEFHESAVQALMRIGPGVLGEWFTLWAESCKYPRRPLSASSKRRSAEEDLCDRLWSMLGRFEPQDVTDSVKGGLFSLSRSGSAAYILRHFQWEPSSEVEELFYELALNPQRTWSELRAELIELLREGKRHAALAASILISHGDKESVPDLIRFLETNGGLGAAEMFLNCGHDELETAARMWALERGYSIEDDPAGARNPVLWPD